MEKSQPDVLQSVLIIEKSQANAVVEEVEAIREEISAIVKETEMDPVEVNVARKVP